MTKLRVIQGNRQVKPTKPRKPPRLKLRATFASLRPFLFAVIFTAAAIVFDAHPVLIGDTASGIMPIVCIIAAWFMTCAVGRASLIFGVSILLSCGATLLYLTESAYAPVTAMMLQGHVVAATVGIIFGAFSGGRNVAPVTGPVNADTVGPQSHTSRSL